MEETRKQVAEAVLEYLTGVDSPLANVVESIVERKITNNIALVGEVINSLLCGGVIVVSGVCPHRIFSKGLDVHIRRARDFRSAC